VAAGPTGGETIPSPIEHATPDVELANAQLAVGRAEVVTDVELAPEDDSFEAQGAVDADGLTDGGYPAAGAGGGPPSGPPGGGGAVPPGGGGAVPLPGAAGVPEPRARPRARLIGFLEGSWRELQRVQWPDRRQVMQATAVVIGFVIVAGIVLGVADTLASHLMSYIITGTKSALAWVAIAVIVLSLAGWMLADRDR
jgi:preprotein translocase SecE subunit